eukprot:1764020-Pyramimonas_sp.AAC.1
MLLCHGVQGGAVLCTDPCGPAPGVAVGVGPHHQGLVRGLGRRSEEVLFRSDGSSSGSEGEREGLGSNYWKVLVRTIDGY